MNRFNVAIPRLFYTCNRARQNCRRSLPRFRYKQAFYWYTVRWCIEIHWLYSCLKNIQPWIYAQIIYVNEKKKSSLTRRTRFIRIIIEAICCTVAHVLFVDAWPCWFALKLAEGVASFICACCLSIGIVEVADDGAYLMRRHAQVAFRTSNSSLCTRSTTCAHENMIGYCIKLSAEQHITYCKA